MDDNKKKNKLSRMRNLAQYKNMSDEEFDEIVDRKSQGIERSKAFEDRIANKLKEFENDYDLSDMKINDMDTMRALIQAQISLEDYEQHMFKLRENGINESTIFASEKLSKIMSELRADISKFQQDLNITRKVRKSDKDVSTIAYVTSLKQDAKKFYEQKMQYIYCPKCNMLLGTLWSMYPNNDRNKIQLICGRVKPDGSTCGEKVVVSTAELVKNRGTNKREITPESFL
jgi:hypothetical protein